MRSIPRIDESARVALLVSLDDRSHNFVEIVTQNADFHVKLFTDREEAVTYLLKWTRRYNTQGLY